MKRTAWNFIYPTATVILLGIAMWIIHDRYIPVQEGWMQYYALLTQRGELPYRDFYYFTQPIPLFIVQIIAKLGNGGYVFYRYYGMAERIILVLAAYYLVSKHFSPTATFIAVVAAVFMYQSFKIDILYTYYQTTLLFFLLALICLQHRTESRFGWIYDFLVGVFASLAFFTKQSNGLVVSVFLLFMMIWYTPIKSWLSRVVSFLFGWAIPASIMIGWLFREHIFSEYLSQVFGGASAKGSITNFLFGFWTRNFALPYLVLFILCSLVFYILWRKKILDIKINASPDSLLGQFKYILVFIFPLFSIGGFLIKPDVDTSIAIEFIGGQYLLLWMYIVFYFLVCATIVIGMKWISKKELPISRPLAELVLASFAWEYSTGLSCQLELYATLLGTAIILAYVLDHVQINWKHFSPFLSQPPA